MQLSESDFWNWVGEIKNAIPENKQHDFMETIKPNVQFPHEIKSWADALFSESIELSDEQKAILTEAGENYFKQALIALENMEKTLKNYCTFKRNL